MEGKSLMPAFQGKTIGRENPLYWEHEGNRAIRIGKWKLVAKFPPASGNSTTWRGGRPHGNARSGRGPTRASHSDGRPMGSLGQTGPRHPLAVAAALRHGAAGRWSHETLFQLKQGDKLPQEESPRIAGQSFQITATLAEISDGVIVAQGGLRFGYTLYVKNGTLAMATRENGQQTVVAAPARLPQGEVQGVGLGGQRWHNHPARRRQAGGRRQSGRADDRDAYLGRPGRRERLAAVGPYQVPFPYDGRIAGVEISLVTSTEPTCAWQEEELRCLRCPVGECF